MIVYHIVLVAIIIELNFGVAVVRRVDIQTTIEDNGQTDRPCKYG